MLSKDQVFFIVKGLSMAPLARVTVTETLGVGDIWSANIFRLGITVRLPCGDVMNDKTVNLKIDSNVLSSSKLIRLIKREVVKVYTEALESSIVFTDSFRASGTNSAGRRATKALKAHGVK